ncbi:SIMPL domain-containing protein [Oceaniglobus indicus]|uniref:SIMPL domain-containing protein n=1 Tax=Oceaniglobus indicus TaxID=2047749 RepID=UPI0019D4AD25|nr:SIMPL domain-containing protein [Oceaniglobus indicus]
MEQGRAGWKAALAVCAMCALPLGTAARAQDAAATPDAGRLTVMGEGSVSVVPDMAILTLGVQTEDSAATAAFDAASATMEKILAALRDSGIEAGDLQTSGLSLSPVYGERYEDAPRAPTMYRASSDLNVRVRDLDRLGAVIDAAAKAGGNSFGGLRFALSDPDEAENAARRAAVQDAQDKAALFADAAGQTIGGVIEMDETQTGGGPMPMMEASVMRSMPAAEGTLDVQAGVRIVFALSPQP